MKTSRTATLLALAAMTLAACENGMTMPWASRSVEVFTPITTEEAFHAQVVGREVEYASGAVGTYGADGTWSITSATGTLARGTWEWSGNRWCFAGTTAQGAVGGCERVEVSASGVRFTREDGTQGTLPFRA